MYNATVKDVNTNDSIAVVSYLSLQISSAIAFMKSLCTWALYIHLSTLHHMSTCVTMMCSISVCLALSVLNGTKPNWLTAKDGLYPELCQASKIDREQSVAPAFYLDAPE